VVFTSDNGGDVHSRNAPLRDHKGSLWEGGVRVPCIARWPGVLPAGEETRQVGITMDWSATIRRSAGLLKDESFEDGIDLMPMLTGRKQVRERTLFWRRIRGPVRRKTPEGRAVRHGKWKWVEKANGERFLGDLQNDVGEMNNLIGDRPDMANKLTRLLDEWERQFPRWYDKAVSGKD